MTKRFLRTLLDEASRPFQTGGHFAYRYARGKLSSDSIFREVLKRGLFPAEGRYLDLGCGQGSLFAWLLAARKLYEAGNWPKDWPAAPKALRLHGIELMQKDVDRAAHAFGRDHLVVRIEQGDMTKADFGQADVITILDALHYFDHAHQKDVLKRIRAALPPGGLFLTRVGDACRITCATGSTTRSPSCAAIACHASIAGRWPSGSRCCKAWVSALKPTR